MRQILFIFLLLAIGSISAMAQTPDTLVLTKSELSIKQGIGLSTNQASQFFALERKLGKIIDSVFAANQSKAPDLEKTEYLQIVNADYQGRMKALLDAEQLKKFELLETTRRKRMKESLKTKKQ
jgi:LysM repeat protein